MARAIEPRIGDILQVPCDEGFVYAQVITPDLGHRVFGVRGFRSVYPTPVVDLESVVDDEQLFAVRLPMTSLRHRNLIVGNVAFGGDHSSERFVRRGTTTVLGIRDRANGSERIVTEFSPEDYNLPLSLTITSCDMLADMVRTGYRDSQAEHDQSLIGPIGVSRLASMPDETPDDIEFFVQLPNTDAMIRARRELALTPGIVEVSLQGRNRLAARGARSNVIDRQLAQVKKLIEQLGGNVEGYGLDL